MKVVSLNQELPQAKRKKELLNVIDSFRKRIEDDEVDRQAAFEYVYGISDDQSSAYRRSL